MLNPPLLICTGFTTNNIVIPEFKLFVKERITILMPGIYNSIENLFMQRSFCQNGYNSNVEIIDKFSCFELDTKKGFIAKLLSITVGELISQLPNLDRFEKIIENEKLNFNDKVTSLGMTSRILIYIILNEYKLNNLVLCLAGLDESGIENIQSALNIANVSSIEVNYSTNKGRALNEKSKYLQAYFKTHDK